MGFYSCGFLLVAFTLAALNVRSKYILVEVDGTGDRTRSEPQGL